MGGREGVRRLDTWPLPPAPLLPLSPHTVRLSDCQPQMLKGKGRELEGEEAAGRVGLGRGRVEAQVAFGAGHGT